ncbi:MAG: hypothetical protein ACRDGG_09215 [Anaerolineae bacterium]
MVTSNPLMSLAVGLLILLGSFIALIGRLDRANSSGCFYTLMLGLVLSVALAIVLGMPGG